MAFPHLNDGPYGSPSFVEGNGHIRKKRKTSANSSIHTKMVKRKEEMTKPLPKQTDNVPSKRITLVLNKKPNQSTAAPTTPSQLNFTAVPHGLSSHRSIMREYQYEERDSDSDNSSAELGYSSANTFDIDCEDPEKLQMIKEELERKREEIRAKLARTKKLEQESI